MRRKKDKFRQVSWGWVFGVVIAVTGVFGALLGWRIFGVWNQRHWFGVEPYRMLVLVGQKGTEPESIKLITIWPDNFNMVELLIPPDLRIVTAGGYGTLRIGALVDLGRVEKVGDQLLSDSVGFAFGVPIHQVLWQTKPEVNFMSARMDLLRRGLMGKQSIKEVAAAVSMMGNVSKNNMENVDLSRRNVLRQTMDTDGSPSIYVEPALLDNLMREKMSAIWKEAALTQVALVNATSKPQVATLWSRFPRMSGYDVVSVTDQQDKVSQTKIIFPDEAMKNSLVGKVLVKMSPRGLAEVADTSKYRAQISIVLGVDTWQWLNERESYLMEIGN